MNLIAKREEGFERGGHGERWHVFHGELNIGIIDYHAAGPPAGTWSWLINFTFRPNSNTGRGGYKTRDDAMNDMRPAWEHWLQWAGLTPSRHRPGHGGMTDEEEYSGQRAALD